MNAKRALYLDDAPGERRGTVTLDGQPERLLIERSTDRPEHRIGARLMARVRRVDRPLATAFVDVGTEPDAVLPLANAPGLSEGERILVEVAAPPRWGKGAVVRYMGAGEGPPRLSIPAPGLIERLETFAPAERIERGPDAREAADAAEAAVLAIEHRLPGEGSITIEPTRALTAIDVDLGAATGDGRRAALQTNLAALQTAARLLRLKGLGGLVVIDLIGKGHDGPKLVETALAAFAPDQPGVSIGRISRFGLLELALPRRAYPVMEGLADRSGAPTALTTALRLLREMEARIAPGAYMEGRCSPQVHAIAQTLTPLLHARIGPRFRLCADVALSGGGIDLRPLDRWENDDGR